MTTRTVQLSDDSLDEIIRSEVEQHIHWFKKDLKQRKKGKGPGIFDTDKKTDIALLKEHIYAFEMVLEYYGGSVA